MFAFASAFSFVLCLFCLLFLVRGVSSSNEINIGHVRFDSNFGRFADFHYEQAAWPLVEDRGRVGRSHGRSNAPWAGLDFQRERAGFAIATGWSPDPRDAAGKTKGGIYNRCLPLVAGGHHYGSFAREMAAGLSPRYEGEASYAGGWLSVMRLRPSRQHRTMPRMRDADSVGVHARKNRGNFKLTRYRIP